MEPLNLDDFSAGWCPSDDALNGRKNALLRMQSVNLDKNGAINMNPGTQIFQTPLNSFGTFHTIFGAADGLYYYAGDDAGRIIRNGNQLKTGGSTTRASFVTAFNYTFGFSGSKRVRDDGSTVTDLGIIGPSSAPSVSTNGSGVLNGDYDYCQINVLRSGSYIAKSRRSAISSISVTNNKVSVTPQNPSVPSSTATEAWIFRRGGNLDVWYRVALVTSYSAFDDNVSDSDALELGITMNDFLLNANSTDIPDDILIAVGPIYNRLVYFTATQIFFTDRNSPDSVDSRTTLNLGGTSAGEVLRWAIKVSANTVLIGTSLDIYILTGTFVQLPDGFLDVTLKHLGVSDPPVTVSACAYQNSVIYMSKHGWTACSITGQILSLVSPNTDILYTQNVTLLPVNSNYPTIISSDISNFGRYNCLIKGNKFYGIEPYYDSIAAAYKFRMVVFDFLRKYWSVQYDDFCPTVMCITYNGHILGYDPQGNDSVKYYDNATGKVLTNADSSTVEQTVDILTLFIDMGNPHTRKDLYTLRIRGYTGSNSNGLDIKYAIDGSTSFTTLATKFKGTNFTETYWDIAGGTTDPGQLAKCIQIRITGQAPDLYIADISLTYDNRPVPTLHLNVQDLGLSSTERKFISALNPVINTGGQDVKFYPVVDGTPLTPVTLNTSKKLVAPVFFTQDTYGVDWTGYFIAQTTTPFEFYGFLPATVGYKQPQHIKFGIFAVTELFRYGKLQKLELRISTLAGLTSIPYSIQFDTSTPITGTLTVTAGVELVYTIPIAKTVAGSVLVLHLGSTSVAFAVIYARILANKSGRDTEAEWINLTGSLIQ